jgi:mitochondrial fission protein ELM1
MAEKAKYEIYLDEKIQIIREKIDGPVDEEDTKNITAVSKALVKQLKDPQKVKLLVSVSNFRSTPSKVRKLFINGLKLNSVYKVAITGPNPYLEALITFFFIATGINKVKLFNNEREAIQWLNE